MEPETPETSSEDADACADRAVVGLRDALVDGPRSARGIADDDVVVARRRTARGSPARVPQPARKQADSMVRAVRPDCVQKARHFPSLNLPWQPGRVESSPFKQIWTHE